MRIAKDIVLFCFGIVIGLVVLWTTTNFVYKAKAELLESQSEMRHVVEYWRNKYDAIEDRFDYSDSLQDRFELSLTQEIQSITAQVKDLNDHRIDEEYLAALDEKIGKLMTNQAELQATVAKIRAAKQCCCPYGAKR